jgi:hypothetical protein
MQRTPHPDRGNTRDETRKRIHARATQEEEEEEEEEEARRSIRNKHGHDGKSTPRLLGPLHARGGGGAAQGDVHEDARAASGTMMTTRMMTQEEEKSDDAGKYRIKVNQEKS